MNTGSKGQFVTSDLSLAAYLKTQGLRVLAANKRGAGGCWEFIVADPDGQAEALSLQWANSCCAAFEANIRIVKSLLHSGARR